jgi:redox-sensitive bicupin YhaK (pirin superfamily)
MANNERLIIDERARDIGNFMVGRLLPFRKKRQVGPFTFIDHMGPTIVQAPNWMDVDQHPHIGLCTFTYLLEGSIEHRDSTGAHQVIHAGDVGMMTAGKAVTHTERTPPELRKEQPLQVHGYQIWIALPKEKEEMEPRFDYVPASDLPTWKMNGLSMKLLAGEAYGHQSPLPTHSELFVLDIIAEEDSALDIKGQLFGEIAVLVNIGMVVEDEHEVHAGQLMVSKAEDQCCIDLKAGSRIMIFGGPKLPEERFLFWNFVSSSKERLKQASDDWKNKKFPRVPGDETYIPLPNWNRS